MFQSIRPKDWRWANTKTQYVYFLDMNSSANMIIKYQNRWISNILHFHKYFRIFFNFASSILNCFSPLCLHYFYFYFYLYLFNKINYPRNISLPACSVVTSSPLYICSVCGFLCFPFYLLCLDVFTVYYSIIWARSSLRSHMLNKSLNGGFHADM